MGDGRKGWDMSNGPVEAKPTAKRRGLGTATVLACACAALLASAAPAAAKVILVGTFNGKTSHITGIQAAVDKAKPGDWVLIGPGDYKEAATRIPTGAKGDDRAGASVLVTTPGIHIRGMNRNTVVLDGTAAGAAKCSGAPADQNLGPLDTEGHPTGRNGLIVFKAEGVSVENLSACNFLNGSHSGGDEIWFDGGASSGKQALGSWRGAYLSSTSTYYEGKEKPFSSYGIYASNTFGPGLYTQVYANNQADAAFYIGACPDCNTTLDHAHAQNSDLGYSGTNSGGHLIVQNSEFDNNKSGFVSNSQNNDDAPSPQDGSCPNGGTGPTGTHSCWLFTKNLVHDNNNPNVPTTGSAEAGPVGSGVVLAGDRNNIVSGNTVYNNGAWGILLVPYPDTSSPPPVANCNGGTEVMINGKHVCYFDDWGNEITNNLLKNNGSFGNPGNVDLAEIANPQAPPATGNCWHGNEAENEPGKKTEPTSEPKEIQKAHGACGKPDTGGEALTSPLGVQVSCDSQFFGEIVECPTGTGTKYPRLTKVELKPLPAQKTMANPCLGVPKNAWCPKNKREEPPYPVPGSPAE